ncbi:unnamed protein product [Malus baccata var. baccata]
MEHNNSRVGENSSSHCNNTKNPDSHRICSSRDPMPGTGSDLWKNELICAFEFIRSRKKIISSKPGSKNLTKQQIDGEQERVRVPSYGFSDSPSQMEDRSQQSGQVQDMEGFEGGHWVPIGWDRISEIVQTVQAVSCFHFDVQDLYISISLSHSHSHTPMARRSHLSYEIWDSTAHRSHCLTKSSGCSSLVYPFNKNKRR